MSKEPSFIYWTWKQYLPCALLFILLLVGMLYGLYWYLHRGDVVVVAPVQTIAAMPPKVIEPSFKKQPKPKIAGKRIIERVPNCTEITAVDLYAGKPWRECEGE